MLIARAIANRLGPIPIRSPPSQPLTFPIQILDNFCAQKRSSPWRTDAAINHCGAPVQRCGNRRCAKLRKKKDAAGWQRPNHIGSMNWIPFSVISGLRGRYQTAACRATIHRLPQRTIELTSPTPGTMSPCPPLQMPPGPSKIAVPATTSRTVQPAMVFGLVSETGKVYPPRVVGRLGAHRRPAAWGHPLAIPLHEVWSRLRLRWCCEWLSGPAYRRR
jgi:hypothetical protein